MFKIKYITFFLLIMISLISFGQSTDSLNHYLDVAAKNNPNINSDYLTYKASSEKIQQAGSWENPELEIGFSINPMDNVGGKQVADFSVMQMFPWFGTKKAAITEASHMANASFEKFRESRDNLFLSVYNQWFVLCSLEQKLQNNKENKKLLTQLEELAIRKFSSPNKEGSGMSDALRVRLEIVELENNIESIKSEIIAEKAKFNELLNRSANSSISLPNSIEKIDFDFNLESSMIEIANQNPTLGMIKEEGLAYKAKSVMNKKMSYPMVGLGLQYTLVKKTNDQMLAMGDMNGRDMFMPMISISLPIYRGKYKSQQTESKLWWESNEQKYLNALNALESELYKTKHLLDDESRKVELYKKQSELAQTTFNLILKEFVSGKSDLSSVIQVQRQLLDYQLKESEAIANYNIMVASIQKLISSKYSEQNN